MTPGVGSWYIDSPWPPLVPFGSVITKGQRSSVQNRSKHSQVFREHYAQANVSNAEINSFIIVHVWGLCQCATLQRQIFASSRWCTTWLIAIFRIPHKWMKIENNSYIKRFILINFKSVEVGDPTWDRYQIQRSKVMDSKIENKVKF